MIPIHNTKYLELKVTKYTKYFHTSSVLTHSYFSEKFVPVAVQTSLSTNFLIVTINEFPCTIVINVVFKIVQTTKLNIYKLTTNCCDTLIMRCIRHTHCKSLSETEQPQKNFSVERGQVPDFFPSLEKTNQFLKINCKQNLNILVKVADILATTPKTPKIAKLNNNFNHLYQFYVGKIHIIQNII